LSNTDELLKELREIYDCHVTIDEQSADKAGEKKEHVVRFLQYTALRALTYSGSDGLAGVVKDESMGPWFRDKTTKLEISYSDEVTSDFIIKWDEKTLKMVWGQHAKTMDHNYIVYVRSKFRYAYGVEEKKKKFEHQTLPRAQDVIARTFGPGKGFEIDVDWDSFQEASDMDRATDQLYSYDGYYSTEPLTRAVYDVATYEEDCIVNAVCDGLKKVTFVLSPGNDPEKKSFEVDKKGQVKLKLCFEISGSSGIFSKDELSSILMAAGLRNKPEYKIYLLSSLATSYRVRSWGWLDEVEELIGPQSKGLFYEENADEKKALDATKYIGRIIKFFGNMKKVNKRGKAQERHVLVTTDRFYTAEVKSGPVIKPGNFKAHTLTDIVCIDIYPTGGKLAMLKPGPKELGFTIWTNEVEEKKPMFGMKLPDLPKINIPLPNMPKINLPGIPLPSLPKIDLPDLPKISMPDMPEMPSLPKLPSFDLSMPEMFKRHKEPKPKRYHPSTSPSSARRGFKFVANGLDTKKGNELIEEIGWVVYAAWCAHTGRSNYEPFYLKEEKRFDNGEQIEDQRPKVEEEPKQ
jgi:hypothetical protein